ncbi:MAG: hypothetical protein ACR2NP_22570 [Pirellulaceae bacterium]
MNRRTANPETQLSPAARSPVIQRVMESLRGYIRRYVLWHGLCLAVIWVCTTYWLAVALDYGPVWFGFSELSQTTRLVLLLVIGCGLAWILYHWVLRRVYRRLTTQSLAMLLERSDPQLQDALATVVIPASPTENAEVPDPDQQAAMMDAARSQAEEQLKRLALSKIFDWKPLTRAAVTAVMLLGSVLWFAIASSDAFMTSVRRVYLLDADGWPRECRIELAGIKVKHSEPVTGIEDMNAVRPFSDGRVIVGKASSISVLVRAELPNPNRRQRRIPAQCRLYYTTADGDRGTLTMNKVGGAREGFQTFAIDGDVLDGVIEDLRFFVRGGDHRIGPFVIEAVPSPIITDTQIECDFPDYLVDESSSRWTSRTIPLTSGTQLPVGTRAMVIASTNRPLSQAYVIDDEGQVVDRLNTEAAGSGEIRIPIEQITEPIDMRLVLRDADGVFSRSTERLAIGAREDTPPRVTSLLHGIGTAVTPDARIPVRGTVTDDNDVKSVWIEVQTPVTDMFNVETDPGRDGQLEGAVDFRQLQREQRLTAELPTEPDGQVALTVMANDYHDLEAREHTGTGTLHELDVVTPAKLLRMLERDEADQRRRLEQILQEMTEARNYIARSQTAANDMGAGFEPGDQGPSHRDESLEDWQLRQLYVQRALLQTQKSMQEIEGVSLTFDHIRLQLINNRVDAEDRKQRLDEQVAQPLMRIATGSMPQLETSLIDADAIYQRIPEQFDQSGAVEVQTSQLIGDATMEALASADGVLSEIQAVLDSLLKFETQNELLDIVRRLLEQEQQLLERTKALREREAFDDLFNQ